MNKLWFFFLLLVSIPAQAQNNNNMNFFRESGKYPVVLGVLFIILGGIFYYLIRLDRKVSKLEKDQNKK